MDLSIVIVSWNAKDYLRKCLSLIRRETTGFEAETIVIDNQSTDGSPDMVRTEFPWVKLIESGNNLGFAKGNNIGLKMATGRYLALINSDVEIEKNCFQILSAYLENHPGVGLAGPRVLNTDRSLQRSCRRQPTLWRSFLRAFAVDTVFPSLTYPAHDCERSVDVLSGCFWIARRSAVEQVGPLDEAFFMYAEDVDWCRRFSAAGWSVVYVPAAQVVHHGGASSANAPIRFYLEMYRASFQYFRKHQGPSAERILKAITLIHQGLRVVGGSPRCLAGNKTALFKVQRSLACMRWILRGCPPRADDVTGRS
jgi:GT2 family glycosyltransferase